MSNQGNYEEMSNRESMRQTHSKLGFTMRWYSGESPQSSNDSVQKARLSRERRQQRRQRGK